MIQALREVAGRRDLLIIMVWREIRVRYKQSVMGMLWAILMPIVIVAAGTIVRFAFSVVSGKPLELSDVTSVAVKAAPWAFFVAALRFGSNSLVANPHLVTKIYFPRLIFPLAAVSAQFVDFCVATTRMPVTTVVANTGLSVQLLWAPLLILPLIVLVSGLAILLSAASLFLRDVKYIVEVLLTFAIFFTPVLYDSSMFGQWAPLLLLNPVSPLLEGLSAVVVHHQSPQLLWVLYSSVVALVTFGIAIVTFSKLEPYFAESI